MTCIEFGCSAFPSVPPATDLRTGTRAKVPVARNCKTRQEANKTVLQFPLKVGCSEKPSCVSH